MKQIILVTQLFLWAFMLNGQSQVEQTTELKLSGEAQISLMPNEVIFSITVKVEQQGFGLALDILNTNVKKIKDELKHAKVPQEDIKTTNYSINENWKYEGGKRLLKGYIATHGITIHVPFDQEQMKSVYAAIRSSGVDVNMRLTFGLSNREEYENQLIELAVNDAKQKANQIANASGLIVSGVSGISYGSKTNNLPRNYTTMDAQLKSSAQANFEVNPGAIELSDQIHMVFILKTKK